MTEEIVVDDASHYEVSLTGGQAFVAFVLLLLSLAAAFTFGVMIGKGQADERLIVRRTPAVVTEANAARPADGKLIEVADDTATSSAAKNVAPLTSSVATDSATASAPATATAPQPVIEPAATSSAAAEKTAAPGKAAATEPSHPAPVPPSAAQPHPAVGPQPQVKLPPPVPYAPNNVPKPQVAPTPNAPAAAGSAYAQLLSTSDPKPAESLAAKLIEHGFPTAYVERSQTPKGMLYRVRVQFRSEAEARAAVDKLKPFTNSEIWVTRQ